MPTSIHQSLEQKRAEEAWKCANDAKGKAKDFKEYVGLVKKLPALLSTNGLGQTLAFLAAKAKTKHAVIDEREPQGILYHHLERWLTRMDWPKGPYTESRTGEEAAPATKLLYRIACGDSTTYRRATAEALSFVTWLKSFADALQEKTEETTEGEVA